MRTPLLWLVGLDLQLPVLALPPLLPVHPEFLHASNRSDEIAPALAALSLGQIPGSLVLGILPWSNVVRPQTAVILSATTLVGLSVLLISPAWPFIVAAAALGACTERCWLLASPSQLSWRRQRRYRGSPAECSRWATRSSRWCW